MQVPSLFCRSLEGRFVDVFLLSNWRMRASGRPSAALTDRCLQCCWMPFHSPAGIRMVAFWAWFGRPNGVPNRSNMNPKSLPGGLLEHLRLLKASWSGLGGLLERSWAAHYSIAHAHSAGLGVLGGGPLANEASARKRDQHGGNIASKWLQNGSQMESQMEPTWLPNGPWRPL